MKTKSYIFIVLLFFLTNITLFGQSGMTIQGGGAVTVNGNTYIVPSTFVCGSPMIDNRDNKVYNTVLIGTQCWFAQNLNIGIRINGTSEQTNNNIIEKYCYNDLEANCNTYGGLYQWNEAMQYSTTEGVKGICPTGWHLPTDAEWTTLTTFLGGEIVAGGKMKEAGTAHWAPPNTGATNETGFTALPGDYRDNDGTFGTIGGIGYWWSSSELSTYYAWARYVYCYTIDVFRSVYIKNNGYAVRCMRD